MTSTAARPISSEPEASCLPLRAVVSTEPTRALPDEAERGRILLEIMGPPPQCDGAIPRAIRSVVSREYARAVSPLIKRHWPASLPGGSDEASGEKLRFLACSLYASAPYTVLFCAENRPLIFRVGMVAAGLAITPRALLPAGARAMLSIFARFGDARAQRRIVLVGAFIATIDHVFDHTLERLSPEQRGERIRGLLDGAAQPSDDVDDAPLRLVRALQYEMSAGLTAEESTVFDVAMARVLDWCESEVHGMTGVVDPSGLCHRLAGVEGTIDGLVFPVHRHAGESVRRWMVDVSWFVQMMDDWLDFEKDVANARATPVITGAWDQTTLRAKWGETIAALETLASAVSPPGASRDAFVALVRDSYISMMHDVRRAMSDGVAA